MSNCKWFEYEQLTKERLEAIFELRQRVFIIEQQSIYPDIDGLDKSALHFVMSDSNEKMIGYVRLRCLDDSRCWKIERVLLDPITRGVGLGDELINNTIKKAQSIHSDFYIKLSSQCSAVAFYQRFGFKEKGETYDDGGIDHIDMILTSKG